MSAENKALYEKVQQMTFNTVTDTGFLFEIGNAAIGFSASLKAGLVSLGVSALCFGARMTGEAKKVGLLKGDLADRFNNTVAKGVARVVNKMSENLGTSLIISGGALMVASGLATPDQVNLTSVQRFLETSKETAILGLFGLANAFRGVARGLKDGGTAQRALDVAGITLASTGVIVAGRALNIPALAEADPAVIADSIVKSSFVGAAGMAMYQAVRSRPSQGLLQPDILFAGGCFGNAAMSQTPAQAFANAAFGVAFLSLDALKKSGGAYEHLSALKLKR